MIKMLVMLVIRFGAQWRGNTGLDKLNQKIEEAVVNRWPGRSPAMVWRLAPGADNNANFIQDSEAFFSLARRLRR